MEHEENVVSNKQNKMKVSYVGEKKTEKCEEMIERMRRAEEKKSSERKSSMWSVENCFCAFNVHASVTYMLTGAYDDSI